MKRIATRHATLKKTGSTWAVLVNGKIVEGGFFSKWAALDAMGVHAKALSETATANRTEKFSK